MIDVNALHTIAAVDAAIQRNIDDHGDIDEYEALEERKNRLWQAELRVKASEQSSNPDEVEALTRLMATTEQRAAAAEDAAKRAEALTEKKVLERRLYNAELKKSHKRPRRRGSRPRPRGRAHRRRRCRGFGQRS